ncbi:MAG: serine/threonine protein kinase [Planctomycetaceae bacterium]|nr:serine/threonine protein kinase [Planctomycetaceae bacterium]
MAGPRRELPSLSPQDATLDAASLRTPAPFSTRSPNCPKIQFVEGSESGLTTQTQALLSNRLRSAALVLFIGAAVFYAWGGIRDVTATLPKDFLHEERNVLRWCHLATLLGLGLFTAVLWKPNCFSLRSLRLMELGIFGLMTAFFVNVQHFDLVYTASVHGYIPSTLGLWFLLIFTYAIYIPNTWQRCAVVLACIMAAAAGGYVVDVLRAPRMADLAGAHEPFVSMILFALIGYGASVYGTALVNTLRREAYEAREFGQYRLRRLLGAGGMGEVYLAEHRLLKRPCALKLVRPQKADDPRTLARFEREVQTIATLSHWNTVEIFDYGRTEDGTFYYVMEYLPGLSVGDLVERHGPLAPARVVYLLEQVCDALREAHAVGLVHRDVKPGNIFAAKRGGVHDVAKLLDFGLVKTTEEAEGIHLTLDGTITGSPLYMSPEQATGDSEPDARSDIYALGAVAYFMLTGRPPFESDKPLKVLFAHANEPVLPPTRLRADVPADLEEVILRCLAKSPAERFQDAVSLRFALRDCECWGKWTRDDAARWWNASAREAIEPVEA